MPTLSGEVNPTYYRVRVSKEIVIDCVLAIVLWIGFRYTSLMNESKSNITSNKSASKAGGKAKRGRGRPANIGTEAFVAVWSKSNSLDDVIKAFKVTRDMDPADAKNYASVRASMLRAKGFSVKQFTRGRKPSAKPVTDKPTA